MGSGLGGALMTGMAMGTGSAIAHTAIRGMMGSGSGEGHENGQVEQQYEDNGQMQAQQQ